MGRVERGDKCWVDKQREIVDGQAERNIGWTSRRWKYRVEKARMDKRRNIVWRVDGGEQILGGQAEESIKMGS